MAPPTATLHLVGHGHIDPTWLWRWTEGYEEVRATFCSALDRMRETPDFTFTASSACFYAWIQACEPDMFAEIRDRVQEGRWELAGGFWVEPDCNIPSGEAFVRHGLYSQAFFEEAFGASATVGFNPDSFGHAGTLPQILRGLGLDSYVFTRPAPPFEHPFRGGTTFHWRAADGSEVIACAIPEGYNGDAGHIRWAMDHLPWRAHHTPEMSHFLCFYGVGNHGGGPTKEAIAAIEKARTSGPPIVQFSTLVAYVEAVRNSTAPHALPVIADDLQHHAQGCYTAHAGIKRWNRRAEQGLMTAERLAAMRWSVQGHPYPQQRLQEAWKLVLYNQFHDILAGTSIETSYDDARDQLGAATHTATDVANESLQALARDIDTTPPGNTLVVVNPLPWPVRQTVKASAIVARGLETPLHLVDDHEKPVSVQPVQGERIGHTDYAFTADLPPLGYRCFHARSGIVSVPGDAPLDGGRTWLENSVWRIEVDPDTGWITRLYDKQAEVETLHRGNVLVCLVDQSDTWSHGYAEWRVEAGRFAEARCELLECGPVRATLRITQRYGQSRAEQTITLYRDTDQIHCRFRINWQERYTFLKLQQETTVANGTATCDTAYGFQPRNTRGTEELCQMWVDLTGMVGDTPYGFALLNDGKYGYDIRGNTMRLSLLRSPAYAFHDPSRHPSDEPWPIMDQGWHVFDVGLVPHAGSWQHAGVVRRAWELNAPAFVHAESAHHGPLPGRLSFLAAESDHVALTAVKQSEDGKTLIVRGYETAGRDVETVLTFPWNDRAFPIRLRAHGIATFKVDLRKWTIEEVTLRESPTGGHR